MREQELLESLYVEPGYYDQLSAVVTEHGEQLERAHVLNRYNPHIPLAVSAYHVDDRGLLSITVGETPDVILQGRWQYRVLVPPTSDGITEMHLSVHDAGHDTNRPGGMPAFVAGGVGYFGPHQRPEDGFASYARRYKSTVERSLEDMLRILDT